MSKLHLAVSHLIFLTKEQRYKLHEGETVDTTGVSVPVWFWGGNTSEPAMEVFCKYHITNQKTDNTICLMNGGYEINIPQEDTPRVPVEEEGTSKGTITSKNLLGIKDGGSEWLEYKVFKKLRAQGVDQIINMVHSIEMKSWERLTTTLSV